MTGVVWVDERTVIKWTPWLPAARVKRRISGDTDESHVEINDVDLHGDMS